MRTLFIADLHLAPEHGTSLSLFGRFVEQYCDDSVDALYILGDLFEFWIGDDYRMPELAEVFANLARLGQRFPVYFMHGNRDFLLGEAFAADSGMSLLPESVVIDLYGSPTLLLHGDTLCTDDVDYQKLRAMVRNPLWQKEILSKPVADRLALARSLRQQSAEQTAGKDMMIMDVNDAATRDAFVQNSVCRMIHGHTHRQNTHHYDIGSQDCVRYVLGDWHHSGSVLVASAEGLQLENFTL